MPADAPAPVAARRRRELMMWLLGVAFAVALLLVAVVAMGGRIESATWGLVVAAGAMVFALRSLFRMASALAQPSVQAVLDQEDIAAFAGRRELREERRRVLRALNELQFDYEMGKLSDEDYRAVREGYELRAVEVMRALDGQDDLHPSLEVELRRRQLFEEADQAAELRETNTASGDAATSDDDDAADPPGEAVDEAAASEEDRAGASVEDASADQDAQEKAEASSEVVPEPDHPACPDCGLEVDEDSRFCKHCGAALARKGAEA